MKNDSPQGLKPVVRSFRYGTAETVPLQNSPDLPYSLFNITALTNFFSM